MENRYFYKIAKRFENLSTKLQRDSIPTSNIKKKKNNVKSFGERDRATRRERESKKDNVYGISNLRTYLLPTHP